MKRRRCSLCPGCGGVLDTNAWSSGIDLPEDNFGEILDEIILDSIELPA